MQIMRFVLFVFSATQMLLNAIFLTMDYFPRSSRDPTDYTKVRIAFKSRKYFVLLLIQFLFDCSVCKLTWPAIYEFVIHFFIFKLSSIKYI